MPAQSSPTVQGINVEPDGGLQISYFSADDDLKANGVVHLHTLCLPSGDTYDDGIAEVLAAAERLLVAALPGLGQLPPLGH